MKYIEEMDFVSSKYCGVNQGGKVIKEVLLYIAMRSSYHFVQVLVKGCIFKRLMLFMIIS